MNGFLKEIEREDFPVTYEVPSPRGSNIDKYLDEIESYDFLDKLSGLNVCNNPVGLVRIDPAPYAGRILDEIGIEPIPHLTCRDSTLGGLQRWLLGAYSIGIETLLTMTGDFSVGDYPAEEKVDHINSLELITGIKDYLNQGKLMPEISARPHRHRNRYLTELEELEEPTDFTVGGVALPGRGNEPTYASRKVEAGIDFFQTQITYDSEQMVEFIEELEKRTERHPYVLVSTTPFSSPSQMTNLTDSVPQVNIPDPVQKRLAKADDFEEETIEFMIDFYKDILDSIEKKDLDTDIGAHIIPLRYKGRSKDIIRRLKEL